MKIIYILSFFILAVPLTAQTPMSLNDCIKQAWEHNIILKNSIIDRKIAQEDYVESIGAFIPRATAYTRLGRRMGKSIDPSTNEYLSDKFKEGWVDVDVNMTLFEGFQRINKLKLQKHTKEKRQWQIEEQRNKLAFDVMDTYYKLLLEEQLLNLANEQSLLSSKYLTQMETFVRLGLKSESDLSEVKARRDGDIFRVKSRTKNRQLTLLYLKQLMNMPSDDDIAIIQHVNVEQLTPIIIPQTTDLYAQSEDVLPSFKIMKLGEKEAKSELAISRGKFSPTVSALFNLHSGYRDSYFSKQKFSDNLGKFIGIEVSIPISTGLERLTHVRKKKLNVERVNNEIAWTKQELRKEMEETILSIRASIEEHKQAKEQVKTENIVLKESERKWEEGLISIFQLMETRNRLIDAKAELTRVYFEYEMYTHMLVYYKTGNFILNN